MIVSCEKCGASFEDEYRSTICPHSAFPANDGSNNFKVHEDAYFSAIKSQPDGFDELGYSVYREVDFRSDPEFTKLDDATFYNPHSRAEQSKRRGDLPTPTENDIVAAQQLGLGFTAEQVIKYGHAQYRQGAIWTGFWLNVVWIVVIIIRELLAVR